MTSTTSSRKGRSIAKKACDCCRLRKTQCSFGPDDSDACIKCLASKVPCTFLQDRRPRGPVSRRLAQFRQAASTASHESYDMVTESKHHPSPSCSDASQHTTSPQQASSILISADTQQYGSPASVFPLPLPLGQVSVEHLVREHTFLEIIQDFQDRIYPSLPLVYLPDLRHALDKRLYLTDAACLRLCFALCAVTVASIPRKFSQYSQGAYMDLTEMVGRACHLVLLSRLATNVTWQNTPTHASMVVSALLAMALLYAGSASAGWIHASESIYSFRSLRLYKKESYVGLDSAAAEICKRAFWTLYIIQIHDRMGYVHSHTGLGYDPLHTDWEFLLTVDDNAGQGETKETTVLAGFLVVNKVFLSVADLLSEVFPGQPPPCVLPLDKLGFGDLSEQSLFEYEQEPSLHSRKLRSFLRVRYRLHMILEKLPPLLRPMRQAVASPSVMKGKQQDQKPNPHDTGAVDGVLRDGYFSRNGTPPDEADIKAVQMEAMWANIQVTSLYIQSVFLEVCIDSLERGGSTGAAPELDMEAARPMSLGSPDSMPRGAVAVSDPRLRTKLQGFRESIGGDLLEVVNACSLVALESNGASMIVKIREIAATLLDGKDARVAEWEAQEKRRWHVAQFVEVLAKLDYAWQQASGQPSVRQAPPPD